MLENMYGVLLSAQGDIFDIATLSLCSLISAIIRQEAAAAVRDARTESFCVANKKSVILIEDRDLVGQRIDEALLQSIVRSVLLGYSDPREDPARIDIDDERRLRECIEQYGIGGFRSNAPNGKNFVSIGDTTIAGPIGYRNEKIG